MGFTAKKHGVSVRFCHNLAFCRKTEAPLDFELKFEKIKICKNLCNIPLCTTDLEYELHSQEIRSFGQLLPQTSVLR
jgi:hypothetical protein